MFDMNSQPTEVPTEQGTNDCSRYCSPEGQLFRKALALIEDQESWCTNIRERRSGEGRIQFCALGAIGKPLNEPYFYPHQFAVADLVVDALAKTIRKRGWTRGDYSPQSIVATFNNHHSHATNMSVWRECGRNEGWM